MLRTACLTILALLATVGLTVGGIGVPLAVVHLAFAVGIVPLIFAAMSHFVPVLTRTGDVGPWIARLPFMAQLAGLLAVLAMQGWVPHNLLYGAAAVDLVLAAVLLNWIATRARATLGSPHPGWRWYAAALGCLMLALIAAIASGFLPTYWRALRNFHLHMNTIGLVGLAALGTLPVLLPTALGKPDPEAASWLRRRLWLVAGGALIIATGSAVLWHLAVPGAALVLVAALGLIGHWVRRFGLRGLLADGVSGSLVAAAVGFMMVLAAGVVHGAGLIPAQPTLLAWVAGFLLPLVTGALSQLLPVWSQPGPQMRLRLSLRRCLAASGTWRGGCFLLAAMALLADLPGLAGVFTLIGLGLFLVGLAQAVRLLRSTR